MQMLEEWVGSSWPIDTMSMTVLNSHLELLKLAKARGTSLAHARRRTHGLAARLHMAMLRRSTRSRWVKGKANDRRAEVLGGPVRPAGVCIMARIGVGASIKREQVGVNHHGGKPIDTRHARSYHARRSARDRWIRLA